MKIKPPNFLPRLPRPLSDMAHYKAAEFKSFLLYYGLPCLWGNLSDDVFHHFLLLVQSTHILLGDSISPHDLEIAKMMIIHFCLNMPVLYGPRYQTSNVHLLLHAVDRVRDLGPLWANSCFYFEDYNGQLRSLFHGTQKIEIQISLAVCVHQIPGHHHCNLLWYHNELNYSSVTTKSIESPRKEGSAYIIGEMVEAKYGGQLFKAIIVTIKGKCIV